MKRTPEDIKEEYTPRVINQIPSTILYPKYIDSYSEMEILRSWKWAAQEHRRTLGPSLCETIQRAITRLDADDKSMSTSASAHDRAVAWFESRFLTGLFVTSISTDPSDTPSSYAKKVRTSLYSVAQDLGFHFRYILVSAPKRTTGQMHCHVIAELPSVAHNGASPIAMVSKLVQRWPNGSFQATPLIPGAGAVAYVLGHDDPRKSSRDASEQVGVRVACPGHPVCACIGPCLVKMDDPRFSQHAASTLNHLATSALGYIENGFFLRRARPRRDGHVKRREAGKRKAQRDAAAAVREFREDARALRAAPPIRRRAKKGGSTEPDGTPSSAS